MKNCFAQYLSVVHDEKREEYSFFFEIFNIIQRTSLTSLWMDWVLYHGMIYKEISLFIVY